MNTSRIRDPRLHRFPSVVRTGSALHISQKILTPARLTAALYLFWLPQQSVARFILFVLGFWCGGAYFGIWAYPDGLPFNWRLALVGAGAAVALWFSERALGFPLTRTLFGKRLVFLVTAKSVSFGRWPLRKSVALDDRPMFVHAPFSSSTSPVYQNAQLLALSIGDVRHLPIVECFGVRRVSHLVSNLNVALALAGRREATELDFEAQRQVFGCMNQ